MKRKLNSYLASGLLDQFPDSLENLSVSQNSDSDILKETKGLSDGNEMSSAVPTSSKSELGFTEISENADVSEGESTDLMYVRGVDAPSAKAPQKIIEKCEQHAKTKRKLDFLSSPVELKASAFTVNSPMPLQERELVSPAVGGISPFNGYHDILPEVPSECANTVLSQTGSYEASDIYSAEFSDPCSLELDISDLMEMSYFDNLMIFPPGSTHDGNSI